MVKPAKVGPRGVVETGLGPVIGVRAPGGVVQKAGGLDQPQPFRVGVAEQRLQEVEQLLAEAGHAGRASTSAMRAASISGSRARRRSGICSYSSPSRMP